MMSGGQIAQNYYEELQGRLRALLMATGVWIAPEQLSLFHELVDANECGVALEMLSEALASSDARIDEAVLADVQSLSEQMRLGPAVVDRLRRLVT
jgi:hypothetical protein